MAKSLIRKNQLHPDINDLVGEYGSGYFISIASSGDIINSLEQVVSGDFANTVRTTGSQIISGNKTFIERPNINGTGVLLSGEIPRLPDTIVYTTGDQTISGNKTFSAQRYVFSGANVVFVDNTGIVSGSWEFDSRPTVNGTGVLLSGEIPELPNTIVYTTGDQTIGGVKTFTNNITVFGDLSVSGTTIVNEVIDVTTTGIISGVTGVFKNIEADNLVYNTGSQNISGVKNFVLRPTVNNTGVLLSGEIPQLPDTIVYTTGDQTISGIKIFNSGLYFSNSGYISYITGNTFNPTYSFFSFNGSGSGNYGSVRLYVGDSVFADSFIGYGGSISIEPSIILDLEEVRWEQPFFFGNTGIANESRIALGAYSDKNPSGFITSQNVVFTTGDQTISGNKTFTAERYVFSGANVVFVDNTGIVSGEWKFSSRPTVNGTGVLLSGEVENSVFLQENLLAYWDLNETAGSRIDSYINNYTLTDLNNNVLSSGSGIIGNAARFTGSSSQTLKSDQVFDLSDNFALSLWINYPEFIFPGSRIINVSDGVNDWGIIASPFNQGDDIYEFGAFNKFGVPLTAIQVSGENSLDSGIWNHVVITKNKNNYWQYYKNGNFVTGRVFPTGENNFNWPTGKVFLTIGQNLTSFTSDGPSSGLIDEVGLWGRELNRREIFELYNNGSGLNYNKFGVEENLVNTTKNQTISGVKAFASRPTVNGTGVLLSGEAAQADLSSTVRTTGNQTISGNKIFINDRSWETGLLPGFNNYFIPYSGGNFDSKPQVQVTVEVTGNNIYLFNIQNRSISGFNINFSNPILESGVILNVRAKL
jgi:hypothetical protein